MMTDQERALTRYISKYFRRLYKGQYGVIISIKNMKVYFYVIETNTEFNICLTKDDIELFKLAMKDDRLQVN